MGFTRQEPEKWMDRAFRPKAAKRRSRKWEKQTWNRLFRRKYHSQPEHPPLPKWAGWEW